MTNDHCPYRAYCKGYERNRCEHCKEQRYRIEPVEPVSNVNKNEIVVNLDESSWGPYSKVWQKYKDLYLNTRYGMLSMPISYNDKDDYPKIKKVTISGPCTIIFWDDGTKTVMRCSEIDQDRFDPEKAILLAFYRKVTGFSKTHAQKELDKVVNEAYDNVFIESVKEN